MADRCPENGHNPQKFFPSQTCFHGQCFDFALSMSPSLSNKSRCIIINIIKMSSLVKKIHFLWKNHQERSAFLMVFSNFLLWFLFTTRILMESLHPCSLAAPNSKESQPKRRLQRSSVQIHFVPSAEKSGINLHIV